MLYLKFAIDPGLERVMRSSFLFWSPSVAKLLSFAKTFVVWFIGLNELWEADYWNYISFIYLLKRLSDLRNYMEISEPSRSFMLFFSILSFWTLSFSFSYYYTIVSDTNHQLESSKLCSDFFPFKQAYWIALSGESAYSFSRNLSYISKIILYRLSLVRS